MQASKSYNIKTAARDFFGCAPVTLYRMINEGKIKTFNVGADKRITEAEIARVQAGE